VQTPRRAPHAEAVMHDELDAARESRDIVHLFVRSQEG
jgi:hypothetical protein